MKEQLYQLFQGTATGAPTLEDLLLRVGVSVVIGLAIFVSYWISHAGTIYSQKFNINLITLTVLTATVMTVIGNNIALSLGMVGALSIVRFRTAVKDPLDTAYMFWSLTMGILIGAGQFFLAAVAVIGIALLITIISRVASKPAETFLLVLRGEAGVEGDVTNLLRRLKHMRLKSKTLSGDGVEITYEIRLERQHDVLINKLLSIPGVQDATLVSYANETL